MPPATTCDRALRADLVAARRIRADLAYFRTPIATDETSIVAAAANPTADMLTLGVPLMPLDQEAIRSTGYWMDDRAPLSYWVNVGRWDLFGGIWIEPPGSESFVVSVIDGDPETIELARCLERNNLEVRYVFAERSVEALHALQDAIEADRKALQAEGIGLISTGQSSTENRVIVGVQGVTDEITTELIRRYGDGIRVEEDAPGQLD